MINATFILINIAAAFFIYKWEANYFRGRKPGPIFIFIAVLAFVFFLNQIGVFTFGYSQTLKAKILFTVYNICLIIAAIIGYKMAGRCPPQNQRQRPQLEFQSIEKIYTVLLICSTIGFAYYYYLVVQFGVMNTITNMGGFHSFTHARENSYIEIILRTFFVSPQPIVFGVGVVFFKRMRQELKFVTAAFLLVYLLNIVLFGGRGKFVQTIFNILFTLHFMGIIKFNLRTIMKVGATVSVAALLVLIASTRRTAHLGSEASFAFMGRYNIVQTIIPEKLLVTPVGVFVTNGFSYFAAPYNSFGLITEVSEQLPPSYGTRSFRLMNFVLKFISPSLAQKQKANFEVIKSSLFTSEYRAGVQWPTWYGYLVVDFGKYGPILYMGIFALLLTRLTRKSFNYSSGVQFLLLLNVFFIAFSSFIFPITAQYAGIYRIALIIFILIKFSNMQNLRGHSYH